MPSRPGSVLLAAVLACGACSEGRTFDGGGTGGAGGQPDDDEARFVPSGVQVSALPGGRGVFDLTALTVRKGDDATEAFATVLNDGDVPACSGSMTIQFFDENEVALDIGIGALLTQRFYRRTDGSDALAACVAPGDVSVVAITDLGIDLRIEAIRSVVYRTTYFALDVVPLSGGLPIEGVQPVARGAGTAYVGTLRNRLGVPVYGPTGTVYPANRFGRVLGMAVASSTEELAAGADWRFETPVIPAPPAANHYAFPTARLTP